MPKQRATRNHNAQTKLKVKDMPQEFLEVLYSLHLKDRMEISEEKGQKVLVRYENTIDDTWFQLNKLRNISNPKIQEFLTCTFIGPDRKIAWASTSNIFTQLIQLHHYRAFEFFWNQLTDKYKKAMLSDVCYDDVSGKGAIGSLLTIAILSGNKEAEDIIARDAHSLGMMHDQLNMLYALYYEHESKECEAEVPLLVFLLHKAALAESLASQYINCSIKLIKYGAQTNIAASDIGYPSDIATDPLQFSTKTTEEMVSIQGYEHVIALIREEEKHLWEAQPDAHAPSQQEIRQVSGDSWDVYEGE